MIPRILVIDDIFGSDAEERRNFCRLFDVKELVAEDLHATHQSAIALAQFCSAQLVSSGSIENSVEVALNAIQSGWPWRDGHYWALVLLDLRFTSGELVHGQAQGRPGDDEFGFEILREAVHRFPQLPIIVLSGAKRANVISRCRRLGAKDFIARVGSTDALPPRQELLNKLNSFGLLPDFSGKLIGNSLVLLQCLASARRAAKGNGHVLLLGETGSGKELLAGYIHAVSDRKDQSYFVFHPFGVAEALQQDNLFGHVKGAFTGAQDERPGLFELTSKGVLFIDEIGDVDLAVQNQLLRPLESRVVARQGSSVPLTIDTKVILATNKELSMQVKHGVFKHDLLNRINAYQIHLPSLAERLEDIPLLVNFLVKQLCDANNARWPRELTPQALARLQDHHWAQGNIRELRNQLERAIRNNPDSELIVPEDFLFETDDRAIADSDSRRSRGLLGRSEERSPVLLVEGGTDLSHLWKKTQYDVARTVVATLDQAVVFNRIYDDGKALGLRPNLCASVSCLTGHKTTTTRAADFIKRELNFDDLILRPLLDEHPNVAKLLDVALKVRPSERRFTSKKILEQIEKKY